jgi:hypothetical protein
LNKNIKRKEVFALELDRFEKILRMLGIFYRREILENILKELDCL